MEKEFEVTIKVTELDCLLLRESVADGKFNGKKFMVSSLITDRSPCIEFDDKYFVITTSDIAKAILNKISG